MSDIDQWCERPWKGVSFDVLDEAGVTIDERGVVTVPYYRPDGSLFRERKYTADGRTWWEHGDGLMPYGCETIPDPDRAARSGLFICEGESDTLAVREAFAGTYPGALLPAYYAIGLPGARTWRPEWAVLLSDFNVIYLLGDGDQAGRRMIDMVHRDLYWARPVWLPDGEDARSILQTRGPRALDPYLDTADDVARLCAAFVLARDYADFVDLLTPKRKVPRRAAA